MKDGIYYHTDGSSFPINAWIPANGKWLVFLFHLPGPASDASPSSLPETYLTSYTSPFVLLPHINTYTSLTLFCPLYEAEKLWQQWNYIWLGLLKSCFLNSSPRRMFSSFHDHKDDLRKRLSYTTHKLEMVEMEFDSTRQYLETELRRAQEELEKFTEKLRRCVTRHSTPITLAVVASTPTNAKLTCGDHVVVWSNCDWGVVGVNPVLQRCLRFLPRVCCHGNIGNPSMGMLKSEKRSFVLLPLLLCCHIKKQIISLYDLSFICDQ